MVHSTFSPAQAHAGPMVVQCVSVTMQPTPRNHSQHVNHPFKMRREGGYQGLPGTSVLITTTTEWNQICRFVMEQSTIYLASKVSSIKSIFCGL